MPFTPGPDNGYPVSAFTASCTSANGGAAGGGSDSSSPITVTGLTNGRTYTCTVTATNGAGTSQPSAASNSVVHALAPDAPVNVTANAANNAAQVVFTAPDFDGPSFDNGSAVTSLTASCTSSDGRRLRFADGNVEPDSRGRPRRTDQPYTCTVDATNAVGTSGESAQSNEVVPEAVPDAPIIGTATRGNGSATVTFTASSDNGSPITSFTAACTSSGTGIFGSDSGRRFGDFDPGVWSHQRTALHVHRQRDEQLRRRAGLGTVEQLRSRDDARRRRRRSVIARGNASVGVSFTAGSDGGLTAQFDASCTSSGSGAAGSSVNQCRKPDHRDRPHQRPAVHVHGDRAQRGRVEWSVGAVSNRSLPARYPTRPTGVIASRSGSGSLSVGVHARQRQRLRVSSFTQRARRPTWAPRRRYRAPVRRVRSW